MTTESWTWKLAEIKILSVICAFNDDKNKLQSVQRLVSYCKIFNPTMPYNQALCTLIIVNFSDLNHHCTGPENIHTTPTEGIGIFWHKKFKEMC